MELEINFDREEDGNSVVEVVDLPGVLSYGSTQEDRDIKKKS